VLKIRRAKYWACVFLLTSVERDPEDQVLIIKYIKNFKHDILKGRDDLIWTQNYNKLVFK
jgi:hypothetical protein